MRKINEILAVVILSLMAVLFAAVGMRLYDTYVINKKIESEMRQQEEVLSRNREAHGRVQEMQQEIEALSGDREKLGQFLEEIRMDFEEAVPVSVMMDAGIGGMTGNQEIAEQPWEDSENAADDILILSVNETDGTWEPSEDEADGTWEPSEDEADGTWEPSENEADGTWEPLENEADRTWEPSENEADGTWEPSENEKDSILDSSEIETDAAVSDNTAAVSGNTATVSDNAASGVSGNDTVSGNVFSISENGTVSGNTSISENGAVSGNMLDLLPKIEMVYPEVTLASRRQIRSSMEETLLANWEDQACLEERGIDFSGKKIACLGDSITAAANLEKEEGHLSYAYPSVLKELLGAEEVYNLGVGGSSIGRYWSDAFVERYTQIPEDTDIIIVMGGTNDGFCLSRKEFGSLTERRPRTFCGDLDELMRGLKEKYPNADIFFATPLPNILQDYLMRERSYLLPQKNIADMILTLSAAYDFPVIDMYNSNILDSHDADIVADYMPDGVHANKAGYRILAEHMAAELVRHYEKK